MSSCLLIEDLSHSEPSIEESTHGGGLPASQESEQQSAGGNLAPGTREHAPRPLISVLSSSETREIPPPSAVDAAHDGQLDPISHFPSQPADISGSACVQFTSPAVQSTLDALRAVPLPPEQVYAPVGGAPYAAIPAAQPEAQHCSATAAWALRLLADSTAQLAPSDLDFEPDTSAALIERDSHGGPGLGAGLLIEEVEECEDRLPQPQRVLAADIVLLCGLYGADSRLEGSWVTSGTADAAGAALTALATKRPPAPTSTAAGPASEHMSDAADQGIAAQVQALIAATLPATIQHLKPVLGASKKRKDSFTTSARQGPATYSRSLAARQLAWLVRQLERRTLAPAVHCILPALLAMLDDPSPFVESQGLWALHHVAVTAPLEDLRWHRELLLDTGRRAISGADERVWPAAASAAVALVCAVEGKDPWASGYDELVRAMLGEAELHIQQWQRSVPWLTAMCSLFPVLGLVTVRYFQRLMPLLLGWLHSPDPATQLESLRALHCVLRHTWPRIPPHASLIRRHLLAVQSGVAALSEDNAGSKALYQMESGSPASPGAVKSIAQSVLAIESLLHCCGERTPMEPCC